MIHKFSLALCTVAVGLMALPAAGGSATGGGPAVSVRVEGAGHTLLNTTTVHTHGGWITKGGTPKGKCSARSAAGALDVATKHRWNGTYSSSLGLAVTSILGETHTFSSSDYWSVWVDNRYAQSGVCDLTLHRGERLLFAAVPVKGNPFPLTDSAPKRVRVGRTFAVKVVWWPAKGNPQPLAGVRVRGGGVGVLTNSRGVARFKATHVGTLLLNAGKHGYIRAARLSVRIAP